jgi:hypothetical protein
VLAPPVYQTANTCSTLIPEYWYKPTPDDPLWGIESAALPADRSAGAWVQFGEAQTGQLDKANGRTKDAVGIVQKCEARDRDAFDALQPKPWWKFW